MNEPTLAERLGGRWSISVIGHSIAVASAAVVVANLVRRDSGGLHLPAAGLALLLTTTMTATTDFVLHHTLFARRVTTPVPAWWAVTKNGASGLVLASSVWWVCTGLVNDLARPAPSMWVTFPALAVWGGSAVTVALDVWWRSARARTALLEEADRLDVAVLQQRAVADDLVRARTSAVDDVLRQLRIDLDDAARSLASAPDDQGRDVARRLAEDLRGVSQGVVRHASSDLWHEAERHLPRPTWRTILVNTLRTQPLRPLVIITVGVMPRLLWEVDELGLARGGLLTLVGVMLLCGVGWGANRAMRRWPRWHARLFVTAVIILQMGSVLAAAVKNSWLPGYVTGPDLAVQLFTGVLLILFSSGWATFWDVSRRRDQLFAERLTPAREMALMRSAVLARAARAVAYELHGGAQARLFAGALALEEAADTGDVAALNEALAGVRGVLETPLSVPRVQTSIEAAVAEAVAAWQGLCDVGVAVDGALNGDAVTVRHVVDEALVNAVRHGGARRVEVRVGAGGEGRVRIEVHNDGVSPAEGARSGLGSAMFDHVAPGRWGRQSDDRGTTLWVELEPANRVQP